MVAALYVAKGGCYFNLPDCDPWDLDRDARFYAGPFPVVAHPPCARWSRLAGFCESRGYGKRGDDGGCFAAALASVRKWGGVLEHPAVSAAWVAHGLIEPPRSGGWVVADSVGGWTCQIDQGHFGHLARKPTWLYACAVELPSLRWGVSVGAKATFGAGFFNDTEKRRRYVRTGAVQRLSRGQRIATPIAFRDLLLQIARSARTQSRVA